MIDYSKYTDDELVAFLKQGDERAFAQIYNRYWTLLFLHMRRMLHDDDLAEDLLQNLFGKLWTKSDSLILTTSLSSYLYKSARNLVLDQIKHQKLDAVHMAAFATSVSEAADHMDEQMRTQHLMAEILSEIARMPEKMREIFELSRIEELSHKEIAERLNLSEHTVRKQIQRALRLLRHRLNLPEALVLAMVVSCLKERV